MRPLELLCCTTTLSQFVPSATSEDTTVPAAATLQSALINVPDPVHQIP